MAIKQIEPTVTLKSVKGCTVNLFITGLRSVTFGNALERRTLYDQIEWRGNISVVAIAGTNAGGNPVAAIDIGISIDSIGDLGSPLGSSILLVVVDENIVYSNTAGRCCFELFVSCMAGIPGPDFYFP